MAAPKRPSIPAIPPSTPKELRHVLDALREAVEVQLGQRNNKLDRAVTFRDLQNGAIPGISPRSGMVYTGGGTGGTGGGGDGEVVPPQPTGFVAVGVYGAAVLRWDFPYYTGHKHTEVWRSGTDDIGTAVMVGSSNGSVYADPIDVSTTYYYWIRHDSNNKGVGPWNSVTGTAVTAVEDAALLIEHLSGKINTTEFVQSLKDDIAWISKPDGINDTLFTIDTGLKDIVTKATTGLVDRMGVVEGTASGAQATADNILALNVDVNSALALKFDSLDGAVFEPDGTTVSSQARYDEIVGLNIGPTTALATKFTNLDADVYDNGQVRATARYNDILNLSVDPTSAFALKFDSLDAAVYDADGVTVKAEALYDDIIQLNVDAQSALITKFNSIESTVYDGQGNPAWNAGIADVKTAIAYDDVTGAISIAATDVYVTLPDTTKQGIQQYAEAYVDTNDVVVRWQVKSTVGGITNGFGIYNDGANDYFVVNASNFSITNPTNTGLVNPFMVVQNSTDPDVPDGVYINDLFVNKANIKNIVSEQVDATYINAIELTAVNITGGSISGTSVDVTSGSTQITIDPGAALPFYIGPTGSPKTADNGVLSVDSSGRVTVRELTVKDENNNPILFSGNATTPGYIKGTHIDALNATKITGDVVDAMVVGIDTKLTLGPSQTRTVVDIHIAPQPDFDRFVYTPGVVVKHKKGRGSYSHAFVSLWIDDVMVYEFEERDTQQGMYITVPMAGSLAMSNSSYNVKIKVRAGVDDNLDIPAQFVLLQVFKQGESFIDYAIDGGVANPGGGVVGDPSGEVIEVPPSLIELVDNDVRFTKGARNWTADPTDPGAGQYTSAENDSRIENMDAGIKVTGTLWLYMGNFQPVDTSKYYRQSAHVRQLTDPTTGGSNFYAGVACYDENFNRIIGDPGNYRYCTASAVTITQADGWQYFSGYITGEGDGAGATHNMFNPGTKYVRPMFIANHYGGNGVAQVQFVTELWESTRVAELDTIDLEDSNYISGILQLDNIAHEAHNDRMFVDKTGGVARLKYLNSANGEVELASFDASEIGGETPTGAQLKAIRAAAQAIAAELPPGSRTTNGDIEFVANRYAGGGAGDGEMQIKSGKLIKVNGAEFTVASNTEIHTPFEAGYTGHDGVFYVVFTEQATGDRWPGANMANTYFFPATYEYTTDTWSYWSNTGNLGSYTPASTDIVVAVGYFESGTQAIHSVKSLLRPLAGVSNTQALIDAKNDTDLANSKISSSHLVGSGKLWTSSLPADGADVTNYSDTRVTNHLTENGVTIIARPGGARRSYGGSTNTGAIKITLPQTWSSTMMSFWVDIFNFIEGSSTSVYVAGYNYTTDSAWIRKTANSANTLGYDLGVRFGHDGTKCCVYIGELDTDWSYLKVQVRDFEAGYSNYQIDMWKDGWDISLEATEFPANISTPIYTDPKLDFDKLFGDNKPSNGANKVEYVADATEGRAQLKFDGTTQNIDVFSATERTKLDNLRGGKTPDGLDTIANSTAISAAIDADAIPFHVCAVGRKSTTHPTSASIKNIKTNTVTSNGARSYKLVMLNTDGTEYSEQTFDVWNNATNATLLADAINGAPTDKILVVYTYDEPQKNRLLGGLPQALYSIGGSAAIFESPDFGGGSAYLLVGRRHLGEGNGIELASLDTDSIYSWVETTFYLKDGNVNFSGGTPKIDSRISNDQITQTQVQTHIENVRPDSGYSNAQALIDAKADTDLANSKISSSHLVGTGKVWTSTLPSDGANKVEFVTDTTIGRITYKVNGVSNTYEAVSQTQIDSRADSRIGALRPDSDYKNTNVTKSTLGLGNVENKSSATIRSELTSTDIKSGAGWTNLPADGATANTGALADMDALDTIDRVPRSMTQGVTSASSSSNVLSVANFGTAHWINVAAHDVYTPTGTQNYTAGQSANTLSDSTTYYVYIDDTSGNNYGYTTQRSDLAVEGRRFIGSIKTNNNTGSGGGSGNEHDLR